MTNPFRKQPLLLLLVFAFFSSPLFSQWTKLNLENYSWEGVDAWSEDSVFVAGNLDGWMGIVLRTYDGFQSADTFWVGQQPEEVHFFDLMNGIVRDRLEGVITTTDGGLTWNIRTPDQAGFPVPGNCMSFPTPSIGYLGADQGIVYKTTDGGLNWTPMQFSWTLDVTDIQFLTPDLGYVASTNGFPSANVFFRKTTDGGQSWTDLLPPVPPIDYVDKVIEFIHPDTGFVGGTGGKLIRTFDGGMSWDTLNPGSFSSTFYLALQANSNGVLHALNPNPAYSLDWGDTWTSISGQPCYGQLTDLSYTNDQQGYFVGNHSSIRVVNSNPSMLKLFEEFDDGFSDIHFMDALTGLKAINNNAQGSYARTTDGGLSWNYECLNMDYINEFAFEDNQLGIAVGSPSKLSRTTDGGISWNVTTLPFNCSHATFPTPTVAFVAENGGNILRSTDAGQSWNSLPNYPIGWNIDDIFFLTKDLGFALGTSGFPPPQVGGILRTTDGGQSWSVQYSRVINSSNYFSTIHFPDAQTGYALDLEMQVYKSTDAGATWTNLPGGLPSEAAYEVFFSSPDSGFVATSKGIRSTTDGGLQWNLDLNLLGGMRHLTFPNPHVGYATESNSLYKMDNSPPTHVSLSLDNSFQVAIYPQPAQSILHLNISLQNSSKVTAELWSVEGRKLKSSSWSAPSGGFKKSISVEGLPAGLYLLKVVNKGKTTTRRISITR